MALGKALDALGSSNLVIANSLNYAPGGDLQVLLGLGPAVAKVGAIAADFETLNLATTGFSRLARDSRSNYTLTMPDYALFDINAAGTTITINGHDYTIPNRPDGFRSGFHVVAVDRRTLKVLSNELYSTNDNPVHVQLRREGRRPPRRPSSTGKATAATPTVLSPASDGFTVY